MFKMGANFDKDEIDYSKKQKTIKKSTTNIIEKNQHNLVFSYEKRKGKPVTIVGEFHTDEKTKKETLKLLKVKLACGGTIKDNYIEIQGNIKDKIVPILLQNGWRFK